MKPFFFFCAFLLVSSLPAQSALSFKEKFNQGKNFFAYNETHTALKIFQELYKGQPNNSNINYLLGICYLEEEPGSDKPVFHLEKAVKDVSVDYDASSFNEKRTPIFVYYYLTIAYSQRGKCNDAQKAKNYFHTLYGIEKNDYYMQDAEKWVNKCQASKQANGAGSTATNNIDEKIITKNVNYTYSAPLYGVQVAALSRLAPVYQFPNLKNVEAFMDNGGTIRYVIGNFIFKEQAEALLKVVQEAGYKDAFVADVNKEKKFSEEIVIANQYSIYNPPAGKAVFKVQIGAFRTTIPPELAPVFLKIDDIEETTDSALTILSVGKFSTYEEAQKKKNEIIALGIADAFIVAYNHNKKIDINMARSFYQFKDKK